MRKETLHKNSINKLRVCFLVVTIILAVTIAIRIINNSDVDAEIDETVTAEVRGMNYEEIKSLCSENNVSFQLVWATKKVLGDIDIQNLVDALAQVDDDSDIADVLVEATGCSNDEAETIIVLANGSKY